MIKLIIFDLDGVLIDAKDIHYETLNKALSEIDPKYEITRAEHLSSYDGLKTFEKLNKLSQEKALSVELHDKIWKKKQQLTIEALSDLQKDKDLIGICKELVASGYKIACCSNSIRKSVFTMLSKLGIIEYMDLIVSNEDVLHSKPHPEMYWTAISTLNVQPEETLIVEDSPVGLLGANRSGAHILRVDNRADLTYPKIIHRISALKNDGDNPKWVNKKMNVLIPMAGAGSRFQQAGYKLPKPLIDVDGVPMIKKVVKNLGIDANFIFIVQKEHREKYNLDTVLNLIAPNCNIIEVDGLTEGAACTTLLAKALINDENPLFIANSDQFVEWNSNEFFYKMNESNVDAGIVTFHATDSKWSFAQIDSRGFVTRVAEKEPISDIATVGFYYFKHGKDYVDGAEQMISKNIRVNGEFYVCPVFNELIANQKLVRTFTAKKMWGLGVPSDLENFLKNYK